MYGDFQSQGPCFGDLKITVFDGRNGSRSPSIASVIPKVSRAGLSDPLSKGRLGFQIGVSLVCTC